MMVALESAVRMSLKCLENEDGCNKLSYPEKEILSDRVSEWFVTSLLSDDIVAVRLG